jgi:serpin B
MKNAFDSEAADFSGIADTSAGNLFLQTAVHQAYVQVDEEGTEAAAATGVGVGLTSAPPSLYADHPFLFLIRDRLTNSILFAGRIEDPKDLAF